MMQKSYTLVAEAHGIGTHYTISLVIDDAGERYELSVASGPSRRYLEMGSWLELMTKMAEAVAAELTEEGFPQDLVGSAA